MAPGSYRLSGKTMGWHPEVPVVAEGWRFITTWGSAGSCVPQQEPTDCHVDISRHKVTANTSLQNKQNHWISAFYLLRFVSTKSQETLLCDRLYSVLLTVWPLVWNLYNTEPSCVHLHRRDAPFATISPEYADNCPSHSQARTAAWTQEHTKVIKPESVSLHLKQ